MEYFWQKKKTEPLIVGLHTKEICNRIDRAIYDMDNGKSTYLIITVPFRHGKSDIVSRYLPAHFIGTHPDCDVMLVTYSASLAQGFSNFSRSLTQKEEYKECFQRTYSKGTSDGWQVTGGIGVVTASGLSSGITGKGYHLGILDDYCSGRGEAESEAMREHMWNAFTNDFFTRQAPASITIILATPWHVDDIIGRIKARNQEGSQSYDPSFQKFEVISFPAMNGEVFVDGKKVKYDYLFEKNIDGGKGRFDADWYKRQAASLGEYGTASLLQCNPQIRGGNLFDTSHIHIHNDESEFPKTKYYRVWDLAHTAKQTQKEDPDWTSGTLLTYNKIEGLWHLWIKDVARIRASAGERDTFIRAVSEKDGMGVSIAVENSLDSKDAVHNLQTILNGLRRVIPQKIGIDKVARAGYVEPIFEAGHVHILRGNWNLDWLQEVKEFPSGKHDDQVDNFTAGYFLCCQQTGQIMSVRVAGV